MLVGKLQLFVACVPVFHVRHRTVDPDPANFVHRLWCGRVTVAYTALVDAPADSDGEALRADDAEVSAARDEVFGGDGGTNTGGPTWGRS